MACREIFSFHKTIFRYFLFILKSKQVVTLDCVGWLRSCRKDNILRLRRVSIVIVKTRQPVRDHRQGMGQNVAKKYSGV